MYLNTIKPGKGSKKTAKRVGRGIGSGDGKTAGRGHKGQHARSGGYHKVGFEGGQMPIQRRLPKVGFNSFKAKITAELRLDALLKVGVDVIDLTALREANLIKNSIKFVKVIATGKIEKAVKLKGIRVTAGAKKAIEAVGGVVEA